MYTVLYCNAKGCAWSGDDSELVSATDAPEDKQFTHCPGCGGTDFTEEEYDDDDYDQSADDEFDDDVASGMDENS